MSKEYVLDGSRIVSLESFFEEISRVLIPGAMWGCNLDAFNDVLSGGFGTPDEGFTLKWRDAAKSRERLGYVETARQLQIRLEKCHPSNRSRVEEELRNARSEQGPTTFDWLVDIIRVHGPGGREAQDNVLFVLE